MYRGPCFLSSKLLSRYDLVTLQYIASSFIQFSKMGDKRVDIYVQHGQLVSEKEFRLACSFSVGIIQIRWFEERPYCFISMKNPALGDEMLEKLNNCPVGEVMLWVRFSFSKILTKGLKNVLFEVTLGQTK